jgi:pyruvate formate lyase activating enzyme
MPIFLRASRLARQRRPGEILRICWETNGSFHPSFLDAAVGLSLESGGCVKFDLKAVTPAVHRALTGVDNRRTRENFARAAERIPARPEPPPLIASTLLVPGYVDAGEVAKIARFIADLDPTIPYSLLAFSPQLYMRDLPPTGRAQAKACLQAASDAGLTRVRIGNIHLLK